MNVFIVHKVRGGRPMMMSKKAYDNGKALIHRDGWRLATEDEVREHYPDIEEVKPKQKSKPKAKQVPPKKNAAEAEEE